MKLEPMALQIIGRMVIRHTLVDDHSARHRRRSSKFILVDAVGAGAAAKGVKVGDIVLPKALGNVVMDEGSSTCRVIEEENVAFFVRDVAPGELVMQTDTGTEFVPFDSPKAAQSLGSPPARAARPRERARSTPGALRVRARIARPCSVSSPGGLLRADASSHALALVTSSRSSSSVNPARSAVRSSPCTRMTRSSRRATRSPTRFGPLNDPKKVFRLLEDALGDELSEVFGVMTLDLHGRLKGMTKTGMRGSIERDGADDPDAPGGATQRGRWGNFLIATPLE